MNGAAAQQLALTVAAVPGRTEMRVDGAVPGALVATFVAPAADPAGELGLQRQGVELFGVAVANEHGSAQLAASFASSDKRGMSFVACAVAVGAPTLSPAGIVSSPVVAAAVPRIGDTADVVVLFGQSNAEGHAPGATLSPALLGAWPPARMWHDPSQAFAALEHGANTRSYGPPAWCGPELSLAHGLTAGGRVVHVVKVAAPGSTLGPSPGPWNEWNVGANELYAVLLHRVNAACTLLRSQQLRPRVVGICMMQGESDAATRALADGYETALVRLLTTLRADLAAAGLTGAEAPWCVLGRVHPRLPGSQLPFAARVRSAQQSAARTVPRVALVETSDLAFLPDGVHFDTPAVVELGSRMAAELVRRL